MSDPYYQGLAKLKCERDHLFFQRYFFKQREGIKFRVNWHHHLIADTIQGIMDGSIENVVINVSPGSSKTELVVISLIARGLALNPRSRFLHLSYSDDLASLNSQKARDMVTSDEYQKMWPLKISDDSNSKKRWNVEVDGQPAGGVYATALGGQVTGFRAGHMAEGFQGAIIIDDPQKPEDAFSRSKIDAANRKLLTTVKSRRAHPKTPIVVIMQRISDSDATGFIESGNLQGTWKFVNIPAVLDEDYVKEIPKKYQPLIDQSVKDDRGRISYWPYKEPLSDLLAMEAGGGSDQSGAKISRHVFHSQYMQAPTALGGNLIKGSYFGRYTVLPKIKYRIIFGDTAQKTEERNDFSVFECWGVGIDERIYLLDLIRGKWEAPELQRRVVALWAKHQGEDVMRLGQLRKLMVEDKSSGTGLVQTLRLLNQIPVEGIERHKDKLTRVMDALPYIEARLVMIPESAPYTNDFVTEHEAFSADNTHDYDDQIDPCLDAIATLLSSQNKLKQWERLA